jgi:hypothetical protein
VADLADPDPDLDVRGQEAMRAGTIALGVIASILKYWWLLLLILILVWMFGGKKR